MSLQNERLLIASVQASSASVQLMHPLCIAAISMPIPFRWRSYGLISRKRAVLEVFWQTSCAETHGRPEDAQAIAATHFRPELADRINENRVQAESLNPVGKRFTMTNVVDLGDEGANDYRAPASS